MASSFLADVKRLERELAGLLSRATLAAQGGPLPRQLVKLCQVTRTLAEVRLGLEADAAAPTTVAVPPPPPVPEEQETGSIARVWTEDGPVPVPEDPESDSVARARAWGDDGPKSTTTAAASQPVSVAHSQPDVAAKSADGESDVAWRAPPPTPAVDPPNGADSIARAWADEAEPEDTARPATDTLWEDSQSS